MKMYELGRNSLIFWILVFSCISGYAKENDLIVYSDVPGGEASDYYELSVRSAGGHASWRKAFAFITRSKEAKKGKNKYFSHLNGWSNTYINFEMGRPVEVEISRVNGKPIRKAVAHPERKVSSCIVRNGKAYITITKPCQITVDLDGQMDECFTRRPSSQ